MNFLIMILITRLKKIMYMITAIRRNKLKKKDINSCTIIEVFNNNVLSNPKKQHILCNSRKELSLLI